MDYRQLQTFTVLAEELHFGRAAQRLHITQPALTQQIKSFENALELRLFTRDRRNVALTAEGQFLLAEARMILGHCDKFRENARSLRQGRKGQLKIGYVGSAIFDPALSVLIGNYRQRKPEADLLIEEHNVNDLITGLLSETVDLAFVRSPWAQYDELESLDIATRPLVAVVPRHHPLASRRAIPLAALAEETFFIQQDPSGVGLGWSAISACRQAGFTPRKIQYTRDVSTAIGGIDGNGRDVGARDAKRHVGVGSQLLSAGRNLCRDNAHAVLAAAESQRTFGGFYCRCLRTAWPLGASGPAVGP